MENTEHYVVKIDDVPEIPEWRRFQADAVMVPNQIVFDKPRWWQLWARFKWWWFGPPCWEWGKLVAYTAIKAPPLSSVMYACGDEDADEQLKKEQECTIQK